MVCSVGRLAVKPLCASGLLPMPPSLVAYTRSGVTLLTDTLLPGLCERVSARGLCSCTRAMLPVQQLLARCDGLARMRALSVGPSPALPHYGTHSRCVPPRNLPALAQIAHRA